MQAQLPLDIVLIQADVAHVVLPQMPAIKAAQPQGLMVIVMGARPEMAASLKCDEIVVRGKSRGMDDCPIECTIRHALLRSWFISMQ